MSKSSYLIATWIMILFGIVLRGRFLDRTHLDSIKKAGIDDFPINGYQNLIDTINQHGNARGISFFWRLKNARESFGEIYFDENTINL